ncbi:hypothetical protein Tco_0867586 [Tanacetum coccineum]
MVAKVVRMMIFGIKVLVVLRGGVGVLDSGSVKIGSVTMLDGSYVSGVFGIGVIAGECWCVGVVIGVGDGCGDGEGDGIGVGLLVVMKGDG